MAVLYGAGQTRRRASRVPILEKAAATWSGEWWRLGGGGTVWDSMAYDPELDLLYVGVGNGSPWNHQIRSEGKGDNLFLASIVALDPDDGSYVWHYQTSPGETWDHTATQHIVVADLRSERRGAPGGDAGAEERLLLRARREDGRADLRQARSPTSAGPPMSTWKPVGPSRTADARFYRTGRPFVSRQNPNGAHTWHPMSFSPETGLVYIPVHMQDFMFNDDPAFKPSPLTTNLGIRRGVASADPVARAAAAKAALASVGGRLIAWDPVTQREVVAGRSRGRG